MTPARLLGAAAAVLIVCAGAPAFAQDAQQRPFRAELQQRMQAHREQALADLRQVLRLRPDQEPAFQALQAALQPPERRPHEVKAEGELTTPQMIARRAEHAEATKAAMDRRDQAILTFYGALSPDQQKTFDALVRLRREGPLLDGRPDMGMGMGHGRMHMAPPGPHGGGERPAPPPR